LLSGLELWCEHDVAEVHRNDGMVVRQADGAVNGLWIAGVIVEDDLQRSSE
jgi:hypothetical protein